MDFKYDYKYREIVTHLIERNFSESSVVAQGKKEVHTVYSHSVDYRLIDDFLRELYGFSANDLLNELIHAHNHNQSIPEPDDFLQFLDQISINK